MGEQALDWLSGREFSILDKSLWASCEFLDQLIAPPGQSVGAIAGQVVDFVGVFGQVEEQFPSRLGNPGILLFRRP